MQKSRNNRPDIGKEKASRKGGGRKTFRRGRRLERKLEKTRRGAGTVKGQEMELYRK